MLRRSSAVIYLIIGLVVVALSGCRAAGNLVLDDTWKISVIETQENTYTDVNEWITIDFDLDAKNAVVSTGSAWPDLLTGIDDVFTYEIIPSDNLIYLKKNGDIRHTITYEIKAFSGNMEWKKWEAGSIPLIGEDGPIERVLFTRK